MGGSGSGKGGKGGAPRSPDFMQIAQQQGDITQGLNQQQTFANRPNQYGPFGYTEWSYQPGAPAAPGPQGAAQGPEFPSGSIGGALGAAMGDPGSQGTGAPGAPGTWTQTTGLAEPLQGAADALMQQLSGNAQINPSESRDRAIDAAYRMATSRLDPRFAQGRASLEDRLANQGFSIGDAGYRTAMEDFGRSENDAYLQALYGAQSGAGNQAFAQALAANMQPFQQLSSIKGLGASGGFTPAAGANAPDLLGAAMQQYGANLDAYNSQQAGKNSKLNAGAMLGSAALLGPGAPAAGAGAGVLI